MTAHVLVLGMGLTGISCVRWCSRAGARVSAADSRAHPPGMCVLQRDFPDVRLHPGTLDVALLEGIDCVALSPGIARTEPVVQAALERGLDVVNDIELLSRRIREQNASPRHAGIRVVAITGSNGKSTVTSMAGEMCKAAGLRTIVAGNIGLPVLDAMIEAEDSVLPEVFVLELSSFQLESIERFDLAAAVLLNLSQDHMDRYADMSSYAEAKARIFRHCDVAIVNREDPATVALAPQRGMVWTFGLDSPPGAESGGIVTPGGRPMMAWGDTPLLPLDEIPVSGLHNAANALAAYALVRALGVADAPMLTALKRFRGLPHRVERVMEIDGVGYFDDSKGTNVGATVAALNGLSSSVVLIAGGDGKGQDFAPLAAAVAARARAVVLIGRDGPLIGQALKNSGVPQLRAEGMVDAVEIARSLAQPGDVVLLSPACASFDMFQNYEHRARAFIEAVRGLKRGFGEAAK